MKNTLKTIMSGAISAAILGLGSISAHASDAKYSPATKSIAGTKPFADSYDLTITSPSSLNAGGMEILNGAGVSLAVKIEATSWPDGSSKVQAESLISATPLANPYSALNQAKNATISVDVGPGATPGDYSYSIQGDPTVTVPSWGKGNATLNLSVAEPGVADTTPPVVTITEPGDGSSRTFCSGGTTVSIAFQAVEDASPITALAANVNGDPVTVTTSGIDSQSASATGSFNVMSIGTFTVTASAESVGGIGDATADFSVNYDSSWLPPLSLGKTSKGGSTIPIKFSVRDCAGSFIHDESVRVAVYEVLNDSTPVRLEGVFGEGSSAIRIDDVAGHYIINFQTAAGTHNYRADVFFAGVKDNAPAWILQGSKQFSVR